MMRRDARKDRALIPFTDSSSADCRYHESMAGDEKGLQLAAIPAVMALVGCW